MSNFYIELLEDTIVTYHYKDTIRNKGSILFLYDYTESYWCFYKTSNCSDKEYLGIFSKNRTFKYKPFKSKLLDLIK